VVLLNIRGLAAASTDDETSGRGRHSSGSDPGTFVTEVVLDASVILKWAFPDRAGEINAERALDLLRAVHAGRLSVVEPPHWLAEVAAVVTRLAPDRAPAIVALLHAMELPVLDELEVYLEAARLSAASGQHVFDTLYHAVALRRQGTSLVTADERYYRSARRAGKVKLLQEFVVPTG
jgi:predicted nucleic acid-binding protein